MKPRDSRRPVSHSPGAVPVRECTVSFVDGEGVRHSTIVYAGSALEAAALGLNSASSSTCRFRAAGGVDRGNRHAHGRTRSPMNKLRMWLDSSGKDPAEAAMKAKLR